MQVAIMQPYLLPYIGYFQLMRACDKFVIYDHIKYTKRGWINRNRVAHNGKEITFTLPLRKSSDLADIVDKSIADSFDPKKLLNKFHGAYNNAPYFKATMPLLERIFDHPEKNLFYFLKNSLTATAAHLEIPDRIVDASAVPADHNLRGQHRVIAICTALNATHYINPEGGTDLYTAAEFSANDINLKFLRTKPLIYDQHAKPFQANLSIIDVLMFNSIGTVQNLVESHFEYF